MAGIIGAVRRIHAQECTSAPIRLTLAHRHHPVGIAVADAGPGLPDNLGPTRMRGLGTRAATTRARQRKGCRVVGRVAPGGRMASRIAR